MLTTKKPLEVRLIRFVPKVDREGLKRITVGLRLTETKGALKGELARAVDMLRENSTLDGTSCEEKMESVRLEFSSPVKPTEVTQVFETASLANFTIGRERSQDAGTIERETSGRIIVEFKFTATLIQAWAWGGANFGDDLILRIEKAQGELPLEEPADPDSQEARNLRIINEEAAEAEKVKAKKAKSKKGKKADKADDDPVTEEK